MSFLTGWKHYLIEWAGAFIVICFIVIVFLIVGSPEYKDMQQTYEDQNPTTWQIYKKSQQVNLEILESKAKVWKTIENDPKLLTPDMIRVLDK